MSEREKLGDSDAHESFLQPMKDRIVRKSISRSGCGQRSTVKVELYHGWNLL
jgi:hypothetical protein